MRELDFYDSSIEGTSSVARYLSWLFPSVETVRANSPEHGPFTEQERWRLEWEEAANLVQTMKQVRKDEREAMETSGQS